MTLIESTNPGAVIDDKPTGPTQYLSEREIEISWYFQIEMSANITVAVEEFRSSINSGTSAGIATIKGLLSMLSTSSATTVVELVENLREAAREFKKERCSKIAVKSASDLFTLFITQVG